MPAPREDIDNHPVDAAVEPALVALAQTGLPTVPKQLAVTSVRWGDDPAPEVDHINVEDDGTLTLEAEPPSRTALVADPQDWDSNRFSADVHGHGPLVIKKGYCDVVRATFGSEGSKTIARLKGWAWSAGETKAKLWAAPLKFRTTKPPVVLWRGTGNLLLAVGDHLVRGWRFDTGQGKLFLLPGDREWCLAIEGDALGGVEAKSVHLARSIVGYALGEPMSVGLFRPVGDDGVQPGLVHLGLMEHDGHRASQEPPALPFDCTPTWMARFIDGLFALAHNQPEAPLLPVIHLYFAATRGFVESKFLHAWVGLESLARWGIESGRFPDGGRRRVADHAAWLAWVQGHKAEIERLAVPGMEGSLVDRVRGAEFGSPTKVQRAFLGLGLPWTVEMADAENVRHGVAHEGAMSSGSERDWDRDRARVGLVKAMLTALLAKLVNYDGPIADRSKTAFNITAKDEPAWWTAAQLDRQVDFRGRRTDEIAARAARELERLRAQAEAEQSEG